MMVFLCVTFALFVALKFSDISQTFTVVSNIDSALRTFFKALFALFFIWAEVYNLLSYPRYSIIYIVPFLGGS